VNTTFTINFRRAAYRQEQARTRRRAATVGVWVSYFGVLAVTLGLYGLNCASLMRRVRHLESQNARLRASEGPGSPWKPAVAELAMMERALANPRRWQVRLARLAAALPPNARLASVSVNPDNLADPADQERLVIIGQLRPLPGQDRMQGIMAVVAALHADSTFAAQYRTIRLAESRIGGENDAPAEFRIECR
jgi:hypothetical protein